MINPCCLTPLRGDGGKQKAPKHFGALNILLQYSNDITNPVKRLYATTNIDSVVSL